MVGFVINYEPTKVYWENYKMQKMQIRYPFHFKKDCYGVQFSKNNSKRDIGFERWQSNKEYALLLDK